MRPFFLALLLLLHALALASAGIWAAGTASPLLVTPLWLLAMCGFMAASFAIFGLDRLRPHAESLSIAATVASAILLRLAASASWLASGLLVGVALSLAVRWWTRCTHPEIHTATISTEPSHPIVEERPTVSQRIGAAATYAALALTAVLIVARPWYQTWGTTAGERATTIGYRGDEVPGYRIDRGVTIRTRAESVWPWLAQIGQDRAGFYSYDWLERAIGAQIHNVDSLVPAWQERQVGDLVRAVQPDFFGGRFGSALGWRVSAWDPPRSLTLENWGTFVVRPIDDSTSRLLVHTRGPGRPSLGALPLAWLGFYLFEPAHFVMERGMLLGIKRRAERAAAERAGEGAE